MTAKASDPRGAGKRTRLTADARREQIIEAARVVFSRSGLAGTRTRDLAAEAGINEAMLYRHFPSKEELFEAAVAQPLEDAVAACVEFAGVAPAQFDATAELQQQQTRQFIYDLCAAMEEIAPLLGVVLFGDATEAQVYYKDRIQPSLAKIQTVIETNYASWPHRDFDPELVVESLFGLTWFLAVSEKLSGRKRNREEVAEQVMNLLMNGLKVPADQDIPNPDH
ncbi:TetR/AcrR family transcriptional regulator [Prescottella sp. R16]|uniref:TetR/AcrR family transcriptional regulator n=1 Tax=Prescottella sp. R16 TaxID=3064529 RepID=UPI00272E3BCC|nr:TetR/AcrR family transcriptional regulator [Prescottella sp. R16]